MTAGLSGEAPAVKAGGGTAAPVRDADQHRVARPQPAPEALIAGARAPVMAVSDEPDVVRRLLAEKPSFHRNGAADWGNPPEALAFLSTSVRPGNVTLEVGAGMSTVVFAAAGARHTVISPDPDEHRLIREYCDRAGIDHSQVRFIEGLSEDVLPAILGRDRILDLAFIDGEHSYPAPVTDWFYVTRALKAGGTLVMECVHIPSVGQTFRHMQVEPNWRLDQILDNRGAAFTMLASPSADNERIRRSFNRAHPDVSFAGRRLRLRLRAGRQAARTRMARRYPALRRIYRHVKGRT
jgi:predicted O-methyltransferase YrrM